MLQAFLNALRVGDLRSKILYTIGLLLVYRVGSLIVAPGIDPVAVQERTGAMGGVFELLNMFSGGALDNFAVFALGVMPYITSSIVIQLLTSVIPQLEELKKEGNEGRRKIQEYTRYATVGFALLQAIGVYWLAYNQLVLESSGFGTALVMVVSLTAGAVFLVWLGERISEYGIGNGVSLLIFTGIVASLPRSFYTMFLGIQEGAWQVFGVILWILLTLAIIVAIVLVQEGQRRIPVQYARRQVGRRVLGGGSTHLPLRINQAGVIPVIFASSILLFPATIAQFIPALSRITAWLDPANPSIVYYILYAALILFFSYFYTALTFNPTEIAENMKKNGGFIPGLRPGRATAEYLDRVMSRTILPGAVFLMLVALSPFVLAYITGVPGGVTVGGTSLIIMVGVALDTMKQIEAQLLMRHYQGFMKG